jgi:hypothetical protein
LISFSSGGIERDSDQKTSVSATAP